MESRFFKRSLDRIKPVESRNESISKEEVQETAKGSSMGEEEKASIIQMDRLQIVPKYSPDPVSASSFAKDVNDVELSLLPHATDPGYNDEGMYLQKRYNVKSKNQTPDWQEVQETAKDSSIGEEKEDSIELDLLNIIKSPDPFEFSLFPYTPQRDNDGVTDLQNRCVMMQKASPISEACLEFGKMPTMQFNAESSEFVPLLHRDRRHFLDFEVPRNRQIMSNNNMASCESSSRFVVPYIGVDLNPIAMSSSPGNLQGYNSTMYSRDICGQETLEIEPRGDVGRELDDVPAETAGVMPILQSSAEFAESMRRRRFLDFKTPRNMQIMSDNSMGSLESSSRFVVPYVGVNLNAITKSSARNLPGSTTSTRNPEKKRPKFEAREPESCKRCNCKKSKCLKLYCDCFAAGAYCLETCSCIDCFNKPGHEDVLIASRKQIESRNPFAFALKVINSSDSVPETRTGTETETGDDASKTKSLASARHKRGCNCKKSNCLMKYCECYKAGVGCSRNCRCEGCNNTSGRMGG